MNRIVFIFLLLFPFQAFAARAADIVEKSFIIRGKDADSIAALLGMNTASPGMLILPWDSQEGKRNCTWGYLPPDSTSRRCEDIPNLENSVVYTPGVNSELRISGHWLDYTTASGPRFAILQFASPMFTSKQGFSSDWSHVLQGEIGQAPLTMQDGFKKAKISIGSSPPFFDVAIMELFDDQKRLFISLDFDTVEQHKQKVLANKACHRKYGHLDGGC